MRFIIAAAVTAILAAGFARAEEAPFDASADARLDETLVDQEWNEMNCVYPRLLVRDDVLDAGTMARDFAPMNARLCRKSHADFRLTVENAFATPPAKTAFPNYIDVLRHEAFAHSLALAPVGLATPLQAPTDRQRFSAVSFDPWPLEREIRANLGVGDGHPGPAHCAYEIEPSRLAGARAHLRDRLFWHAELFRSGYECTVRLFKAASAVLNREHGVADAQAEFDRQRTLLKETPHQRIKGQPLAGLHIAIFPQLAYEAPPSISFTPLPEISRTELLSYPYLARELAPLGATVDVVDRVSAADREVQIQQSRDAFKKLIGKYTKNGRPPRFLVFARSMGGMVARELFEREPGLRAYVSGVVMVGCTPYGSVIAEYDSRADRFDVNYLQRQAALEKIATAVVGGRFRELHNDASNRKNIESMSYREFDPEASAAKNLDVPVLNVVQLPDTLGNYFGFKRAADVDLTMLLMAMYGPTEGSTPISHASWDTARSGRVFVGTFNHLGLWGLSPALAVDYELAAILTAKKYGLW